MIKISRETFGYFGEERGFFARALFSLKLKIDHERNLKKSKIEVDMELEAEAFLAALESL